MTITDPIQPFDPSRVPCGAGVPDYCDAVVEQWMADFSADQAYEYLLLGHNADTRAEAARDASSGVWTEWAGGFRHDVKIIELDRAFVRYGRRLTACDPGENFTTS